MTIAVKKRDDITGHIGRALALMLRQHPHSQESRNVYKGEKMNFVEAMNKLSPKKREKFCLYGNRIIRLADLPRVPCAGDSPRLKRAICFNESIVAAHVPHDGNHVLGEKI